LIRKIKIIVPISKIKGKGSPSLVPLKVTRRMMTSRRQRKIKRNMLKLKLLRRITSLMVWRMSCRDWARTRMEVVTPFTFPMSTDSLILVALILVPFWNKRTSIRVNQI
jgi:hypothetical protein